MGSLMPGWDSSAPGVPPKEFQDHPDSDDTERQGYFAKYTRMKSMRADSRSPVDQTSASFNLSRRSAPATADSAAFSLQRAQSLPVHRATAAVDIITSPRAGVITTGRAAAAPSSPTSPRSPPVLTGKSWSSAQDKAGGLYDAPKWWKKFSSAHLNEMPEEDPNAWRTTGYTPQYGVAGQKMQYLTTNADGQVSSQGLPNPHHATGANPAARHISVH